MLLSHYGQVVVFSELSSQINVCFYDVLDQSDPGLKLDLSYRLNYIQVCLCLLMSHVV